MTDDVSGIPPITSDKWGGIPHHCRDGLYYYLTEHRNVGHFLAAILENNLLAACRRADRINQRHIYDYIFFLENYAPRDSYGSPDIVRKWLSI